MKIILYDSKYLWKMYKGINFINFINRICELCSRLLVQLTLFSGSGHIRTLKTLANPENKHNKILKEGKDLVS